MASLEKTDYKIKVGNRIRKAREAKRLTPIEVYKPLGISSGKYSQWENGWALPRMDEALELVGALETSLDYVFRGIGAPQTLRLTPPVRNNSKKSGTTRDVPSSSGTVPLKSATK